MRGSLPFVSIIMPSYNQAEFIEESINSVLTQSYPFLELVIADGQSTDETVGIIERLHAQDSRIRWVSQADEGPADALNKALIRCRGTIIGWLNSDDLFAEKAVERAVDLFMSQPDYIMAYGHGHHIDLNGKDIGRYPTHKPDCGIDGFAKGCFICQPTVFFRRSMYVLLGPLDQSLATSFDYEYWLRAFRAFKGRIGFLDEVRAFSRLHEECITKTQRATVALEGIQLTYKYLGTAGPQWVTSYIEELKSNLEEEGRAEDFHGEAEAFLIRIKPYYPEQIIHSMQAQLKMIASTIPK